MIFLCPFYHSQINIVWSIASYRSKNASSWIFIQNYSLVKSYINCQVKSNPTEISTYIFEQLTRQQSLPKTRYISMPDTSLLLHDSIVSCGRGTSSILAPEYHRNHQGGNRKRDKSTSNEHILESIPLYPRGNSKRDSNTNRVTHKRNSSKSITCDLDTKV